MKNIRELRDIICEEIDNVRTAKSTPATANSVANLTGKVFTSIKLELEYARLVNRQPKLEGLFVTTGKQIENK